MGSEQRRREKEWELSDDLSAEGAMANALFNYLVGIGEIKEIDEDVQIELDRLNARKESLENEYQEAQSKGKEMAIAAQIQQIEEELTEYDDYYDVYDIEPTDDDYYNFMKVFEIERLGAKYAIGDEWDIEEATKRYLEGYYDEVGYDNLPDWLIEESVDKEQVFQYVKEIINEEVWNEPEVFLDESDRELSHDQLKIYEGVKSKYQELSKRIRMFITAMENENDSNKKEELEKYIRQLDKTLENLMSRMEELESDPQGDFSEERIEEWIEKRVEYYEDDPVSYLNDYGIELAPFIDQQKLIEEVISSDGFQIISSYDGAVGEEIIDGVTYYIVRID
jgi:hypothetical protein